MTSNSRAKAMSDANLARSRALKARWAKRKELDKAAVVAVTKKSKTLSQPGALSVDDVTTIIAQCGAHGVISFQYAGLQLLFKKAAAEPISDPMHGSGETTLRRVDALGRVVDVERKGSLQESADLAAEELEHLKITDPAAFESFMQSGDADDGDDS